MCVYMWVQMCVNEYIYIWVQMCVDVCIYVGADVRKMCVYIYVGEGVCECVHINVCGQTIL